MFYHVRVKTTGWVGFGFAKTAPNNMMNYDVIVGGFSNGKGYLHVSFSFIVFVSFGRGVNWAKFLRSKSICIQK